MSDEACQPNKEGKQKPNDAKDWKFILQQTGLPLEQSVKTVLKAHDVKHPRELQFERLSETGATIVSSIDVYGSILVNAVRLSFAIECKHRRDDVQWLFAPESKGWRVNPNRRTVFNLIDEFSDASQFDVRDAMKPVKGVLVGKGVEIKGSNSVDQAIRTAFFQLRYGIAHLVRTHILEMIDEDSWVYDELVACVPMVVTNAALWRLKDDVGYEAVRAAKNVEEVAERKKVVMAYDPPDSVTQRDVRRAILDRIDEDVVVALREKLAQKLPARATGFDPLAEFLERVSARPTFIYVMDYEFFRDSFGSLIDFAPNLKTEPR